MIVLHVLAVIALAFAGALWHLAGVIISGGPRALLVTAAVLVVLALWAAPSVPFGRRLKVSRHRSRWIRLRVHLRMRPGPGHATLYEMWSRWGRWSSFRESKRSRPGLSFCQRLRSREHSAFLGRAHLRHGVRLPVQEHAAVIAPPRGGKSGLLSHVIMGHRGPLVSTSSKPDMLRLTGKIRSRSGPVDVFCPQKIGGVASTVRWSPVAACVSEAAANRIADGFCNAVSLGDIENGSFFAEQASFHMRSLFVAAALAQGDMRLLARWVLGDRTEDAVAILTGYRKYSMAKGLSQLMGKAEKTTETIRMVMTRAIAFMLDPDLATCTLPAPGCGLDIPRFLEDSATLYMIAKGDGKDSTLAPLFAAMACEIQYQATLIGSANPGGRLDPPLQLALDEVTQICPVPLPQWLADSGGQGVQIITAFHGLAQLRDRFGTAGAQTVIDTSGAIILLPGIKDRETLQLISTLAGQHSMGDRGRDGETQHDTMTPEMIRRLPRAFGLIIRDENAPVIARMARGWRHHAYIWLRLTRRLGLLLPPAEMPLAFDELDETEEVAGLIGDPVVRATMAQPATWPPPAGDFGQPDREIADITAAPAVPNPWGVR